jgi:hypothetical protein
MQDHTTFSSGNSNMIRNALVLTLAMAIPSIARAQTPDNTPISRGPRASAGPAVQIITSASAVSKIPLGSISGIRELDDGTVLVNDPSKRRLLRLDTAMALHSVVLDSISESENAYGASSATLLKYRGDSTLVFDQQAYAVLQLDGNAKISRVRAVWNSGDAFYTRGENVDYLGRILFKMPATPAPPKVAPPAGVPWFPAQPDSAFIVAVDFDTRKLDTIATLKQAKQEYRVRQTAEGSYSLDFVQNPLPLVDTWGVLEDGTVAIVRGIDYRVDYLNPDGKWTSSPKQPYEWQRLLDEDKKHMVDSIRGAIVKQAQSNYVTQMIRWVNMYNKKKFPPNLVVPTGYNPPPGLPKEWALPPGVTMPANYVWACAPGVEPVMGGAAAPGAMTTMTMPAGAAPAGGRTVITSGGPPGSAEPMVVQRPGGAERGSATPGGTALPPGASNQPSCFPAPISIGGGPTPPPPVLRITSVVEASDLPDYKPPFGETAKADRDGNIWVRTNPPVPTPGVVIYDVINKAGEMINRIQLPPGYTLIGFGKGKVVYLSMRDPAGIHLARVRLR